MVSLQRHAPFEEWRDCRLATDIAEIHPSPYALPLSVRLATTHADEIRMGFAPTMVRLPNGESVALNGREHFFVKAGASASEVILCRQSIGVDRFPEIYEGPKDVAYFIADTVPDLL